jgi:hypothetical protein
MINTNPATLRSGTVWFDIELSNTANSGNVDLYDLSALKYEFDLKTAESAITSVGVIPGAMTIKVNDQKPDGSSVYEALSGELANFLVPLTPTRNANMHFLKHGEVVAQRFPFQLQFTGVKTDAKSGMTSLAFIPPYQSEENVRSFYPNVPENQIVFRVGNTNYNARPMGDVIKHYVNVNPDATTVYETGTDLGIGGSNGYVTSQDLVGATYDNSIIFGFVNTNSINSETWTNGTIRSKVVSAACAEGAVFGSAFNVNFYINRRKTTRNVSLTNSDITELEYSDMDRQVNGVNVFLNTQTYTAGFQALPTSPKASYETAGYPLGSQFVGLDLQAHAPQFNRGNWEFFGATTTRVINADSVAIDLVTGFLVTAGSTAYSQAFSAYQVQGIPSRIQTTVLGVDKVKPYEAIKFEGDAPDKFKGKHFRPSSLEYDFKEDTVKITAYQIFP